MCERGDFRDFFPNELQVAGSQSADILYHIQFIRSLDQGQISFGNFGSRCVSSEREPDRCAHLDSASREFGDGDRDPEWIDANRMKPQFARLRAKAHDVGASCLGFEQRMVDERGKKLRPICLFL